MSWIIYLVLIAFAIYLSYNFAALSLFGTPASLSNTYYLYKERQSWQRFLFPVMMCSMAMCLMPAWLEISEGSNFQCFLCCSRYNIYRNGTSVQRRHNDKKCSRHKCRFCGCVCNTLDNFGC